MCLLNCLKQEVSLENFLERKSVPLTMDHILQRLYKPEKKDMQEGLCCSFAFTYFLRERT